jgi:hypothetical protein
MKGKRRSDMKKMGRFDSDLEMFVEEQPKEINWEYLKFLRWCGEQGRLEHGVAGPIPAWATAEMAPSYPAPSYTGKAA